MSHDARAVLVFITMICLVPACRSKEEKARPEPAPSVDTSASASASAEAERKKLQAELARLKGKLDGADDVPPWRPTSSIENHGQIDHLDLPADWGEMKPIKGGVGTRHWRGFHPKDEEKPLVSLYYRGLPLNDADTVAFRAILAGAPHALTQKDLAASKATNGQEDPKELDLRSARTEDLSGRRVLVMEGHWRKLDEDVYEIWLDADPGSARAPVQEIAFQGPPAGFKKYLPEVKKLFAAMKLKPASAAASPSGSASAGAKKPCPPGVPLCP